jgi:hypothetical protein
MRRSAAWIAGALCAALGTGARAEEDVTKHPGYVDFGALNSFSKENTAVEVFLDEKILEKASICIFNDADADMARMLVKLKQFRVQNFDIEPAKLADLEAKTVEVSKKLEARGWSTLIKARDHEQESQTFVYIKWKGDKAQGLAIMNVEPGDEATFINIVGEIDPEQIRKLASKFDIDALDGLEFNSKDHAKADRER